MNVRAETRVFAVAALLAAACGGCTSGTLVDAPPASDIAGLASKSPVKSAADVPLVVHAAAVGDDLLFGGPPTEIALRTLAEKGFSSVLTVLGTDELDYDEQAVAEEMGMTFIRVPMPLPVDEITDEMIDAFDAAMRKAPRPMLVHCMSGNAVAGLYAVWLAEHEGVPAAEAVQRGLAIGLSHMRPKVHARLGLADLP